MSNFRNKQYCLVACLFVSCMAVDAQSGGVREFGKPSSPTSKAGAVPYTDIGPYIPNLEKKIASRSPQHFLGIVSANFKINKNGSIGAVKVSKSSGMTQIDDAAVNAIKSSAPFDPLPSGVKKDVDIHITFDGTSNGTTCHTTFKSH